MEIKANRLVLRYWTIEDAPALFEEAQNPKVGPKAGWPAHCTLSDSQQVIQDVLMNNQTFAIVHYGDNKIIGSIGYFEPRVSEYPVLDSSYEIGYWIGEPYWGQGYGPEAARALISYLFEHRSAEEIWGGFYEGNTQSYRVLDKLNFTYHNTEKNKPMTMLKDKVINILCY